MAKWKFWIDNVPGSQLEPKPVPRPEGRLLDLDGLRGVAILMVLLCHYGFALDLMQPTPYSLQWFFFDFFASGVNLFFVLSGFLIGGILLDHRTSPAYFRAFYGRRIFRIFPVYYGFLVFTGLAGVVLHAHGKPSPVFNAGTPYWMFFLFLQNFSLGWYGDWKWITVTMAWSLALEEQFYLTLPIAVKRLGTKTLVRMATLLVLGAPVLRFFVPDTPHAVGSLLHQALLGDGLAAGFLCATLVRSHFELRSIWLGTTALVLAPFVVLTHLTSSPVEFLRETSLLTFYSCILLLAERGSFAALRSFILRFFGTISYTLYLVHQSALVYLHHIVRHELPSNLGRKAIFVSITALLISIAASWFSWVHLEKPLLSWARRKFRY